MADIIDNVIKGKEKELEEELTGLLFMGSTSTRHFYFVENDDGTLKTVPAPDKERLREILVRAENVVRLKNDIESLKRLFAGTSAPPPSAE